MDSIETVLEAHSSEYFARLNRVQHLAGRISPILKDQLKRNAYLSKIHPNLTIANPVSVTPLEFIPDPTNQSHIGRFAYSFAMAEYDDATDAVRPVSMENLQKLATNGLRGILYNRYRDHRARPAYYRAMALMPGFFINLTAHISDAEQPPASFGPELFLAYQVMSSLIDSRDPGVMQPNDTVDKAYLFRRTVLFPDRHLSIAS